MCGLGESPQRSRQRRRQRDGEDEPGEQPAGADREHAERDASDVLVHGGHRLCDPDGPHDRRLRAGAFVHDGDGRRHDVCPKILTRADDRRRAVGEGRDDLRAAGRRVRLPARGPERVRHQRAGPIDDDHAAGHLRRRVLHDPVQGRRTVGSKVLRADVLRDRRRTDDVLPLELCPRTPVERERQRNHERGDRDDRHVREGHDEPPAYAHRDLPSRSAVVR